MPNAKIADLVREFVGLNRRRTQGHPPLSVLELQRWGELRDLVAWELGESAPVGTVERGRMACLLAASTAATAALDAASVAASTTSRSMTRLKAASGPTERTRGRVV